MFNEMFPEVISIWTFRFYLCVKKKVTNDQNVFWMNRSSQIVETQKTNLNSSFPYNGCTHLMNYTIIIYSLIIFHSTELVFWETLLQWVLNQSDSWTNHSFEPVLFNRLIQSVYCWNDSGLELKTYWLNSWVSIQTWSESFSQQQQKKT